MYSSLDKSNVADPAGLLIDYISLMVHPLSITFISEIHTDFGLGHGFTLRCYNGCSLDDDYDIKIAGHTRMS